PLIFDPNIRAERWPSEQAAADACLECVPGAFLVKCSRAEARLLTGEDDVETAAAILLGAGARHVVVSLGADGALLRGGGLDLHAPGVPARTVDATGAGDVLLGTLIAQLAATGYYPPALAAGLAPAVAAAARSTERWGAASPAPVRT